MNKRPFLGPLGFLLHNMGHAALPIDVERRQHTFHGCKVPAVQPQP